MILIMKIEWLMSPKLKKRHFHSTRNVYGNVFVQGMQKILCECRVPRDMKVFPMSDPIDLWWWAPSHQMQSSLATAFIFFTASQRSWGKVMFPQACVCPKNGMPGPKSLQGLGGRVYQGVGIAVMTWVWCGIPVPSWYPFPLVYLHRYWHLVMATEVGGMHPTGMLSCTFNKFSKEETSSDTLTYFSSY